MVIVEGADLKGVSDYLKTEFPQAIRRATTNALNDTARFALQRGKEVMTKQVNFPAGYLDEPERFFISQYAQDGFPEVRVTARARPTSLLRFAMGNPTPASTRGKGAQGVDLMVKPGDISRISSAFVISLNNGNYGIAVKVKNGQVQAFLNKNKFSSAQLSHNFYLLYGPSVDQVFRTVASDLAPEIAVELNTEFARQLVVQIGK